MVWNPNACSVTELFKSDQLIHVRVAITGLLDFLLSLVYARNMSRERVQLWSDLKALAGNGQIPWIFAGDFNTTLKHDERLRGGVMDPANTRELQDFTSECELQDMRFTEEYFTWCNQQDLHDRIYCKLDRSLVNASWIQNFPLADTFFGLDNISDHTYGLIMMGVQKSGVPKPFRFCDAWIQHPNCFPLVQEAWQVEVQGHPMFRFVTRLKYLKNSLKKLHRENFNDIEKRVQEAKQKLIEVQHKILNDLSNYELQEEEKVLKAKYTELLSIEEQLLKQSANVEWMQNGDLNTAFFHAYIKQKRAHSTISTICTEGGQWLNDEEEIKAEILQYYENFLGSSSQVQLTNIF